MISIYELRCRYLFKKHILDDSIDLQNMFYLDSGRSALYAILKTLKKQLSDPVVYVNAYTTDVVHTTIKSLNLPIVLLDIDVNNFTSILPNASFDRNSIFIQTGLFGFPSFNNEIYEAVKEAGGIFIEDACNSFGTLIGDKFAGTLGDASIFSFRIGKAFSSGGGGACINSLELRNEFVKFYITLRIPKKVESYRKFLRTWLDYFLFEPWVLKNVSRPVRKLQKKLPLLNLLSKGGVVDTEYEVNEKTISRLGFYQKGLMRKRANNWEIEKKIKKEVSENLIKGLENLPVFLPAKKIILEGTWNYLFFPILLLEGEPDSFISFLRDRGFDSTRFHNSVPLKSFPKIDAEKFKGTFKLVDTLVCIPNTTRMLGLEKELCDVIDDYFNQI